MSLGFKVGFYEFLIGKKSSKNCGVNVLMVGWSFGWVGIIKGGVDFRIMFLVSCWFIGEFFGYWVSFVM